MTANTERVLGLVALVGAMGVSLLVLRRDDGADAAAEAASPAGDARDEALARLDGSPPARTVGANVNAHPQREPSAATGQAVPLDATVKGMLHRLASIGEVQVRVLTPDGAPFFEAVDLPTFTLWAIVTREPVDERSGLDADGTFGTCSSTRLQVTPEERARGVVEVVTPRCAGPLWVTLEDVERTHGSLPLQEGASEVVFVLDPTGWEDRFATLALRAVDSRTDESLGNACVQVLMESVPQCVSCSPGGEFLVKGLAPGSGSAIAWSDGHAEARVEIELEPGALLDLGDVPLRPLETPLRVHVRGRAEVDMVTVEAQRVDRLLAPEPPVSPVMRTVGWPVDGRLDVELDRGRLAVRASAQNGSTLYRSAWSAPVELGEGLPEVTLELLPSTRVELRVETIPGYVLARDERGYWADPRDRVRPDSPATFELVPGKYELVLRQFGREQVSIPLEVGAEPMEVVLP